MRLLHTSDWHLGRGLHGVDLGEAQRLMVEQIIDVATREAVDVVLVSGDVFDRAVPPVSAVRLWSDALSQLAALVPVVVVPGNHDSATRLGVGAELYRDGVHVVAEHSAVGTPILLRDDHGCVAIYPIPFLDPDVARHTLAHDEPLERSHAAVMTAAMARVRSDVVARSTESAPVRSVVLAHAFVVSGGSVDAQRSESERDIRVGGVDSVPVEVFDGVDYVALGHLHGAQRVGSDRVRYCGSPLRYSFSEAHQDKQVLVVDLGAAGVESVRSVPLEQPRGMATVSASLEELLDPERFTDVTDHWLQVSVTDTARPPEVVPRVRERFPHALVVRHVPVAGPLAAGASASTAVPSTPMEVAESFVSYVTGGDIEPLELAAFQAAYEAALSASRSQ